MHKLIREASLSENKVKQLKLINIDGTPSDYRINLQGLPNIFAQNLEKLKAQIKRSGSNIHHGIADQNLYQWLVLQSERIKSSKITAKEYAALLNTGFTLEIAET